MRLKDLLDRVDTLRPSQYDAVQKAAWVGTLQKMIYNRVLCNYEGFDKYQFEKDNIDGRRELGVRAVEGDSRIAVDDGPFGTPYDIVGQRIFAGNDYYTVIDTDYDPDPLQETWGLTVNGTVPSGIRKVYPAATVFREDSDELLLTDEWEEMYVLWMISKMDFYNSEYERYNNDAICFNALFDDFKNHYIRNNVPIQKARIKRIGEFNA